MKGLKYQLKNIRLKVAPMNIAVTSVMTIKRDVRPSAFSDTGMMVLV